MPDPAGRRVSRPGTPLKAYHGLSAFRPYLPDVGLPAAMGGIDARALPGGAPGMKVFHRRTGRRYFRVLFPVLPVLPPILLGAGAYCLLKQVE